MTHRTSFITDCFVWRHSRYIGLLFTLDWSSTVALNLNCDVRIELLLLVFNVWHLNLCKSFCILNSKYRYAVKYESVAVFIIEHLNCIVARVGNVIIWETFTLFALRNRQSIYEIFFLRLTRVQDWNGDKMLTHFRSGIDGCCYIKRVPSTAPLLQVYSVLSTRSVRALTK